MDLCLALPRVCIERAGLDFDLFCYLSRPAVTAPPFPHSVILIIPATYCNPAHFRSITSSHAIAAVVGGVVAIVVIIISVAVCVAVVIVVVVVVVVVVVIVVVVVVVVVVFFWGKRLLSQTCSVA